MKKIFAIRKLKSNKTKKKILLCFCVLLFVLATGVFIKSKAGVGENSTGWLWGGGAEVDSEPWDGTNTGIGWVSTNSTNCDTDNDGSVDNADCINAGAGGTMESYGINVPDGNGAVDGYAWSENLGWVDFSPQSHCVTGVPSGDQYQAASCADPDGGQGGVFRSGNNLTGWARITGIARSTVTGNSDWEGWLKMYNVNVNGDSTLSGYAWNGEKNLVSGAIEGFGWVSLKGSFIPVFSKLRICSECSSAGSELTSITMLKTDSDRQVYVCLVPSTAANLCEGVDKTNDPATVWSIFAPASGAIALVGNGLIHPIQVGSDAIKASYDTKEASMTVVVGEPLITCWKCNSDYTCSSYQVAGTCLAGDYPFENDCYINCREPDYNWRETRP